CRTRGQRRHPGCHRRQRVCEVRRQLRRAGNAQPIRRHRRGVHDARNLPGEVVQQPSCLLKGVPYGRSHSLLLRLLALPLPLPTPRPAFRPARPCISPSWYDRIAAAIAYASRVRTRLVALESPLPGGVMAPGTSCAIGARTGRPEPLTPAGDGVAAAAAACHPAAATVLKYTVGEGSRVDAASGAGSEGVRGDGTPATARVGRSRSRGTIGHSGGGTS